MKRGGPSVLGAAPITSANSSQNAAKPSRARKTLKKNIGRWAAGLIDRNDWARRLLRSSLAEQQLIDAIRELPARKWFRQHPPRPEQRGCLAGRVRIRGARHDKNLHPRKLRANRRNG